MPFLQSADSLKAKAHLSAVKTPVLVGIAVLVLVVLFLFFQGIWGMVRGDGFTVYAGTNGATGPTAQAGGDAASVAPAMIIVDIGGAVVNPGVYTLEDGARVQDAVTAAGGLTPDAAPASVNLARKLFDGEQVIILTQEEAAAAAADNGSGVATAAAKVNINTAGLKDLETLPGIGEATAKKIIADREANGPFRTVEDLMRVSGIGEKKFADLRDYITV